MTADLSSFAPRVRPDKLHAEGRHVILERIADEKRFDELYEAFAADAEGAIWDWLPYGPFADREAFKAFARTTYLGGEPCFYAIIPTATGKAAGVASLMRTDTINGVTEIGHVCFSPSLQRTPVATEAFYRFMAHVFDDLGYRRFEWKCNDANVPSKRAAERLGFVWEGLFRQHLIVKGKNRDTAWFSILDSEWPALKQAFEAWLDPANSDVEGRQRCSLSEIREGLMPAA